MMKKIGNLFRTIAEFTKPIDAERRARTIGLGSRNRQKREEARNTVKQMGSEMLPFLLELVEGQKRRRQKFRIVFIVLYTAIMGACILTANHKSDFQHVCLMAVSVLQTFMMVLVPIDTGILFGLDEEIAMLLVEAEDIRSIPILLAMHPQLPAKSKETVQATLTQLLPTVTQADGALIDEPTRLRLLTKLEVTTKSWPYYPDVSADYVVAIVQCLSNLEEERVHPHLVKLNAEIQLNRTSETLATAAKDALPKIEAAIGRNSVAGSLLRPAESGNDSVLLLPAGARNDLEENLLYPSSGPQ